MSKTDRSLRKFVTALLKYAENGTVFNPDFTREEIPEIFSGWTDLDFNLVHHGAGEGCCICIGPDRWRIDIAHCKSLQGKFKERRHKTWILLLTILALIAIIVFGVLNYTTRNKKETNKNNKQTNITIKHI